MSGAAAGFGSLAQLGNQLIGQSMSHGLNARAAATSWDKWKDSLTRGPTYMMQGYRKAGINPILAATGSGFKSTAQQIQSAPGKPGSPGDNPGIATAQGQMIRAQTEQAQAGTSAANAQAALTQAKADVAQQEAEFYQKNPQWIEKAAINKALPATAAGIAAKEIMPRAQEMWDSFWEGANEPGTGDDLINPKIKDWVSEIFDSPPKSAKDSAAVEMYRGSLSTPQKERLLREAEGLNIPKSKLSPSLQRHMEKRERRLRDVGINKKHRSKRR